MIFNYDIVHTKICLYVRIFRENVNTEKKKKLLTTSICLDAIIEHR